MQQPAPSLAICITVWNRGDLFAASFASLLPCLNEVAASIWIFDNGSDLETKEAITNATAGRSDVFRLSLPRNMGIPYAVNVFGSAATQASIFASHVVPDYIAIFDGDMFFKHPIRPLIDVIASDSSISILSGHDSIEHKAIAESTIQLNNIQIVSKIKEIERGCFYLMRTSVFTEFLPLPHDAPYNVDWQMMVRHPRSLANTKRKLVCIDCSVHLGLFDSTWSAEGVPASKEQVFEIVTILEDQNLMSDARRERALAYIKNNNLPVQLPAPQVCSEAR